MDVVGEVGAHGLLGQSDAGCPLGDEGFYVCLACDAAGVGVVDELLGGDAAVVAESFGADGPDGGDPGQAGAFAPELREVEPEQRFRVGGIDGGAVFAGEQGGVADEECSVGVGQHREGLGGLLHEVGTIAVEVGEEDLGVGEGAARGGVGGYGADGAEGFVDAQTMRVPDEEKDAADFAGGADGAAGDDGEVLVELGDWDEA